MSAPGSTGTDFNSQQQSATANLPATVPPSTSGGLFDFSTPMPYLIGGGLLLVLMLAMGGGKSHKGGKKKPKDFVFNFS